MNDFLPSRKVIAFVLIPILTIFAVWSVIEFYKTPITVVPDENPLQVALLEGQIEFQNQDTDGDGLKDWEEFLYQTDETNPDTDGDGSTDGAEVQKGFDPLFAGNGTSTEGVTASSESGFVFYKDDPTLNKTDVLARDLFIGVTELSKAEAVGTNIQDGVIQRIIDETTTADSILKYDREDLSIVADSFSAKNLYRQQYQAATQTLSGVSFYELELMSRAVEEGDETALVELGKNGAAYVAFAEALRGVKVPESISQVHLELINNLLIMAESISQMQGVEEDPLNVIVYSDKFLEDEGLVEKNLDAISLYFNRN